MSFKELPQASRLYVILLITAGVVALGYSFKLPLSRELDFAFAVYLGLAIITSRMTVKVPFSNVHFSIDTAFVFAIIMLYGMLPAIFADAIGKFVLSITNTSPRTRFKIPFNVASGVLAVFGASYVYTLLLGSGGNATLSDQILPIVAMVTVYYLVNTTTVATGICITEPQNLLRFWLKNFLQTSIGFYTAGSIAALLFILDTQASALGFLVTIPIIGLTYFSQQIYLQKEEESHSHISELEDLHMSTVRALALATDAKDAYTHGHVHRVQAYAVSLARKLGIEEEATIKGISFAAQVHDIGKIAIPDAILNKPGKYSESEFQIMKSHPIIGAEMLKGIPLPFPVSKIVRHHHEKWNGRGYPDGLAGQEIPFESRILTVVDVYDAIRSSRPYRPKMEKEKAIAIMRKEKGFTLDPSITDVFLEHLDELEHDVEISHNDLMDILRSNNIVIDYDESHEAGMKRRMAYADRERELFDGFSKIFASESDAGSTLEMLSGFISNVVPHSTFLVYVPDEDGMQLRPLIVSGKDDDDMRHNVISISASTSGWVFSNEKPTVCRPNDAEFANSVSGKAAYQSCLSLPIIFLGKSIGVITLYSFFESAFAAEDQDLLFRFSPFIGSQLKSLIDRYSSESDGSASPAKSKVVNMPVLGKRKD
ncbi:MAG: HD domain-containing phosphohydrolase [Candidatus Alcyoniella australis]|nr:HD domain-containing phosphohydrolase [Candidatus Alcyoniella australis]